MKTIILSLSMILVLALLPGCVSMQKWPDQERSVENKIVVIQEKVGGGLKSGALTTDQSQMYLTTLKGIQTDYGELRSKNVYREPWDSLQGRLDTLGRDVDQALARTTRIDAPASGDKIILLQKRIDDGRVSGRLSTAEGQEFQLRLDSIRSDYIRMTEGGRSLTNDERAAISLRLESLEMDLNRLR